MPVDYKNYPPNWKEISQQIRTDRAKTICECLGECGTDHKSEWLKVEPETRQAFNANFAIIGIQPDANRCRALNYCDHPVTDSKVILTVAHLCKCAPLCANPEHLKAMCQRCHLRLDAPLHAKNARRTRQQKRISSGALFDYSEVK